MANIGNLIAELSVNDKKFNRDLKGASKNVNSFAAKSNRYLAKVQQKWSGITNQIFSFRGALAGAASAAAMGYFIKRSLDMGDTIAKTADRIGISTDALQELRYAAEINGVEFDQMDKAVTVFTKRLGELRQGTGALHTYLTKLDADFEQQVIQAGSTEEAFDLIIKRMKEMESQSDRAALGAAAFSRTTGVAMTKMVDSVDELRERARSLGIVIDEDLLRGAEAANDAITDLSYVLKANLNRTILELAPTITDVASRMTEWVAANDDILKQKIPEYLDKIERAFGKIWEIISYDPAIVEFGLVGLLIGGRKGALLAGSLAHMMVWASNLSKALGMASAGIIDFKEVAQANFKELEDLVLKGEQIMQGGFYRAPIIDTRPKGKTKSGGGISGIGDPKDWKGFDADTLRMVKKMGDAYGTTAGQMADVRMMIRAMAAEDMEKLIAQAQRAGEEFEGAFGLTNAQLAEARELISDLPKETEKATSEMENAFNGWASNFGYNLNEMLWGAEFTFDNIGRSFAKMLSQMAIQAAIVEPFTGFTHNLFSGLFGKGKAGGGPVRAGVTYPVGEEGVELFTPSSNGYITPNDKLGRNVTKIERHYHLEGSTFQNQEELTRALQLIARQEVLAGAATAVNISLEKDHPLRTKLLSRRY